MTTSQIIMLAALVATVAIAIPAAKKIMRPGGFKAYLVYLLFLVPFWLWLILGTNIFK